MISQSDSHVQRMIKIEAQREPQTEISSYNLTFLTDQQLSNVSRTPSPSDKYKPTFQP